MYDGLSNREILEVLYDRSERIEKLVFGKDGLSERVANLEGQATTHPVAKGGTLGAVVAIAVAVLAKMLGVVA